MHVDLRIAEKYFQIMISSNFIYSFYDCIKFIMKESKFIIYCFLVEFDIWVALDISLMWELGGGDLVFQLQRFHNFEQTFCVC